ncbi:MAG: hypothetical protein A2787_05635 [Omnitrophica WOR_2 bacterium RIFCSPHIGHO2_01_FULL_48_9]|nr:MAG: hypothetical protein A3D10_07680 [Omnitrophica WOR_2 bacterium RIFCSPHIGHO2_02_FULL_48_11]OGX32883.1 MAG: hypothetical protein A2787_05635 [Omnitrophica WOR_2 bacterium RIFCSPHIGHO2_01_FULL_48_9]
MKNKKILIFLILIVAVVGGLSYVIRHQGKGARQPEVYYCPMHPTYTSDRPGTCPICNMNLVKKEITPQMPEARQGDKQQRDICLMHDCHKKLGGKPCPMMVVAKEGETVTCPICGTYIVKGGKLAANKLLYWTDPMIPGYKSDKPGKSPMGMDLVPVYEEEFAAPSSASVPEGYAQIMLSSQKQQLIGIKTAPVEKKKLIKTIRTVGTIAHDPELYQAQTEYIQAIQAWERAKQSNIPEIIEQSQKLAESSRIRLRHMGLNEELIKEISTWKEAEHSLLYASPGEPVWVYAKVYEYELPLIRDGQKLKVEVPANPGYVFEGILRSVDQMVDQETRTVRIRAQVQDPGGQLKPDMFVNVTIEVDLGEVLAVPEEAVFDTGTKKIVFLDNGQGVFEPRDVVLSAKVDNFYELKSGLQEGDRIVTSGNFLIDSESRLKAALEGMGAGGGGHQHGQ